MKNVALLPIVSLLFILTLAGCKHSDTLEVKKMNFTDQIDQFQNLQFTFNHDVAPDSILERWDSTAYIEFEPAVNGRFRWITKRDLEFSPAGPFAPNTDYKATLTGRITGINKHPYTLNNQVISFHTPYLELSNGYSFWTFNEGSENNAELHVMLQFNYAVETEEIKKFIKLSINGKNLSFGLIRDTDNTRVELIISPDKNERFSMVSVVMEKGMKAIGSLKPLSAQYKLDITAPATDILEITDVTAEFEEGVGVISINTSQPVLMQGLRKLVRIDPAVEFEIQPLKSGFSLRGDFNDGETYQVILSKGIKGILGPELEDEVVQSVTFGALQPYIQFADESGMYLTPGGESNLGLRIINVPKVKITVFRIFENNIQHYLRKGMDWDWYSDEDSYYESYEYGLNQEYGKVICTREYSTNALPKTGNLRLLHLKPQDLQIADEFKGIYLIKAESSDKAWLNDVQLLSYSDIGLIVKEGTDEIFVATRSIASGQPIEGVSLGFYSTNNQLVHKMVTGRDGIAIFKDVEKTIPGFAISMITARKGEDFNVIVYNRSRVDAHKFDVGGKYTQGREFDGFIYGDRDLYRPGDSVHCNIILRDFGFRSVTGLPVKFRVISPDGKDFLKKRLNLSNTGSTDISFLLPEKAYTGTYTCELLTINDVYINSYRIKVEEFMPDRISVVLKTDKKEYSPGEKVKLTVTAMNLFGPPATGRKVENELRMNRVSYHSKNYSDKYNFYLTSKEDFSVMSVINQTVTGSDGKAIQEFELPGYVNAGLFLGKIYTTVFDENGRPVNRLINFDLYTQNTFLGISQSAYWLSTERPVNFQFIAVNKSDKQIASKAKLEVVLTRWETVIERNYGRATYRSQEKEKVLVSREINIPAGGFKYSYIPQESGDYKIKLSLPDSKTYVESRFYAYRWGGNDENNFMVNKDGQIDITFDKDLYAPDQKAKILFKTPFEGELLVTVEQNKVISYHSLKADKNGAVLNLDVKDDFIPNVYVTATLMRKASVGGIPLTVAHGFASMKVERSENKLPVLINAPEQIRSHVNQKISLKTAPGAEVTVAVVDEGILQITDYKTPDPYGYFYAKRALEVDSYDIFDELLPELAGKSKTGGDQGFDLGRRLNPLTSKRVKLLSLWSGRMTADKNGDVTFTARIPQFSGAVRIMAAAYKNNQFGSGEKKMKVADPVTISSSVPRFLSPGDEANVSVTLTNTTTKDINATLSVDAVLPLKAGKPDKTKILIPANSEARVSYVLTAVNNLGVASVTFKAVTGSENFTEKTDLTVRPAVPLVKEAESGSLAAGKSLTFDPSTTFMKGTARSRLLLSNNPAAGMAEHLESLINYPYGCIEQTVSAAFPQLYFEDLSSLLKKENKSSTASAASNVNEAIRKITSFQQYNGGIVTWAGYSEINWWNTAYAAHFLYEAERAGFTVEKAVTSNMHKYLLEMLKNKELREYFYYSEASGRYEKESYARREIFYSLFVLALNGKQHLPTMNYYKSRPDLLTKESKYLLASTFRLIGDEKSYNSLLPKSYGKDYSGYMTGESFGSPIRNKALALYVLLSADPQNPQIAVMASQLGQMVNASSWLSTQERVYTVLALGKLARNLPSAEVGATIITGNKTLTFKDKNMVIDLYQNSATINVTGKGYLFWYKESEGIPLNSYVKEEDRTLEVRRRLLSRLGVPVNPMNLKQNDLIVVELTLKTTDYSSVDNVVITDLLPACFEIENSRLTEEREMEWIKNRTTPEYLDIRDDRINFFTSASNYTKTFYYMVRVVNKGSYYQGPVGAEAMYYGQYFSYFGAQKITVR